MKNDIDGYVVALDVGERRIGVALTHSSAGLPKPLVTLENDDHLWSKLSDLLKEHQTVAIIVGLPRDLSGRETSQTAYVQQFVAKLREHTDLPIHLQDEALTSVQAEQSLRSGSKGYNKGMVDAEAAAIILGDFLTELHKQHV